MGKGLGSFESKVIDVKAGQIIFEFSYISDGLIEAFIAGIKGKLPASSELVFRFNEFPEEDDDDKS